MDRQQQKYSDLMHRFAEDHHFSGTVLVAKEGEILYQEAFGLANRELEVPNRIGSKYRIASLTKAFTAMAVLQLAEQGTIQLHDRLRTYFPDYAEFDERITLHHLLSHTSGLRDIEDVPQFTGHLEKLSYDKPGFIALYKDLPPFFAPGEGWKYGNCGYTMLAYIIEAVTGLSYEQYLRQHIFEPLGMNDTGCDSHTKFVKHRSYGYSSAEGDIIPAMYYDIGTVMASGDLYSTAYDLLKWDQALYSDKLVSSESIQLMFTPHAHVSGNRHYGYGWNIYPTYTDHNGWLPGYWCRLRRYPEERIQLVLLSNHDFVQERDVMEQLSAMVFKGRNAAHA
ncbi:serine hydrolase domain-containing protein [Paenibacillus terrigena]|uniref:serine hydrolase domain-containing protein n=1 Tax=Paenibacillus terrigena TaxID=369333 RepID=UPI0028D7DC21|nr:serine hydrolase domain-containing protein [Paenibacillus terrigena]